LLLVNALIFAVLAAAVALAYYGYSYATSEASRDREKALVREVAEEKVLNIEALILRDEQKLFDSPLPLATFVAQLDELTKGLRITSVFVLDEQLNLIPSGYRSLRTGKEGVEFREWFQKAVLPELPLKDRVAGVRGHLHAIWD